MGTVITTIYQLETLMGNKKTMAGNQSKHPDYYYYTSMILPISIGLG